ncbi:MAG TPA: hypothetical protein VF066_11480 [Thermoleophilaceae bacterium]
MQKTRAWLRVCVIAALVCALGVTFAGPASASITKAKKQAIAKKLIRELKKNPRLIKNRTWLTKAGHVDATLPLTVRLNKIVKDPISGTEFEKVSDDTAQLDLTETFGPEVGLKTTRIVGKVNVMAHFGNPAEGDDLGDLRLTVTGADLYASSVPVLENPTVGATCTGIGAPAPPDGSLQEPAAAPATGYVDSTGAAATPAQLASGVTMSTVFRTAPIHLTSLDIAGSPNIGKANLFTTSNNVRLALHVGAEVNTIFRASEFGAGMPTGWLPTALFACDESYAGTTNSTDLTTSDIGTLGHQNVIPVNVTGNLAISPAITTDGRLRLATVQVSSPDFEHSTVDACLQPTGLVQTAKATSDSATATGSGTALVNASTPRTVECNATYNASNFKLAIAGVQELTPSPDAKFVKLEPDVKVTNLTGEALVGTF